MNWRAVSLRQARHLCFCNGTLEVSLINGRATLGCWRSQPERLSGGYVPTDEQRSAGPDSGRGEGGGALPGLQPAPALPPAGHAPAAAVREPSPQKRSTGSVLKDRGSSSEPGTLLAGSWSSDPKPCWHHRHHPPPPLSRLHQEEQRFCLRAPTSNCTQQPEKQAGYIPTAHSKAWF